VSGAGPSRRQVLRGGGYAAGLALGGGLLTAGCQPPKGAVGEAVAAEPRPSYYPGDYDRMVRASKAERELTIYSNMDTYNWKPIVDGFQKHYPWVDNIATTNLGSSQVFERYNAEEAANQQKASLLVSGSPQNWLDFVSGRKLLDYASPELPHLPSFARPRPGLYTFSTDCIVMVYNKVLLGEHERPDSLAGLITLVRSQPKRFKNKITTYSAGMSFGLAIHDTYVRTRQRQGRDAWATYDALLPFTRAEESSGPMLDKVASGEYLIAYFASSTIVFPQMAQVGEVVTWKFVADGTPLFLRGMGVPAKSPHKNTGKLMLDYILSHEGQSNVSRGGFTAYRPDVPADAGHPTYTSVTKQVGKDNVMLIGYDFGTQKEQDAFVKQWEGRLG
jgi:iron(III) transport system substrate-binding protein